MALKKRFYVDGQTVINAQNLNDIQDSVIVLEGMEVANALQARAEGAVVRLSDICPFTEELEVGVDAGVTVQRYGKNLLDLSKVTFPQAARCTYDPDTNTVTSNITEAYYCTFTAYYLNDLILASVGKSFTFSVGKGNETTGVTLMIYGTRTDGSEYQTVTKYESTSCTITVDDKFQTVDRVAFRFNQTNGKRTDTTTVLSDFQFELSATATEYEPYKAPTTHPADGDGVVNGITYEGTDVTLVADSGAAITAEYNKDTNKVITAILERLDALEAAVVNNV